jgi:hypothetical protein
MFPLLVATGATSDNEYVVSTIAGGVPPTTPTAALDAPIGSIVSMVADPAGKRLPEFRPALRFQNRSAWC